MMVLVEKSGEIQCHPHWLHFLSCTKKTSNGGFFLKFLCIPPFDLLLLSPPLQRTDNGACELVGINGQLVNGVCQMVSLQKTKFYSVNRLVFVSSLFSFLKDRTNQDPMKRVSGCLSGLFIWFWNVKTQRGNTFSSHPSHSFSKFEDPLDGSKMWEKEIGLGAPSVTKKRERKLSLFTCQMLWANLTVFGFFSLYSHCWHGMIDHTFVQGLAWLPLAKYWIIFSPIVCRELAGGITISPCDSVWHLHHSTLLCPWTLIVPQG